MPYILTCENYFSFFTGSPGGEIRDSILINESKDEGITTVATTKSNEDDGSSSSNIDLRNLDIWNIYGTGVGFQEKNFKQTGHVQRVCCLSFILLENALFKYGFRLKRQICLC